MALSHTHGIALSCLAAVTAACGSAATGSVNTGPDPSAGGQSESSHVARASADSARYPYTGADVRFMSQMIGHHAQAVVISRWVPTRTGNTSIRTLAARIINAQQDEIAAMQTWLRDRRQAVPDAMGLPTTKVNGAAHHVHMPGMLTEVQMKQLDAARGNEFDRMFLTLMIQHHQGAVSMVEELFGTSGAAQDETVFRLASDVNVDQVTEIARMQTMLAALTPNTPSQ